MSLELYCCGTSDSLKPAADSPGDEGELRARSEFPCSAMLADKHPLATDYRGFQTHTTCMCVCVCVHSCVHFLFNDHHTASLNYSEN